MAFEGFIYHVIARGEGKGKSPEGGPCPVPAGAVPLVQSKNCTRTMSPDKLTSAKRRAKVTFLDSRFGDAP